MRLSIRTLATLTLLLGAAQTAAAQSVPRAPKGAPRARGVVPHRAAAGGSYRPVVRPPALSRAMGATVTEAEPNDSAPDATPITLEDTASGAIGVPDDIDFFAINLTAGTLLTLDVDAQALGSPLDPVIGFFDTDGTTLLAVNDDSDGLDSYLEVTAAVTGTYYVAIVDYYAGTGDPSYVYRIKTGFIAPGPGDPTTFFATVGYPIGMAAAATGDLYVADNTGQRVVRVTPAGAVSTLGTTPGEYPQDIVVDGFGDLLVTVFVNGPSGPTSRVLRFTTAGAQSVFSPGYRGLSAVTVGPDGDVWIADVVSEYLFRLDPTGGKKDSISIVAAGGGVWDLAFSPAGELHYTDFSDGVFKISSGAPVRVITQAPFLDAIAFDQDGYLYLGNGYERRIRLYSPTYQVVNEPFALSNMDGPHGLTFMRNGAGAMTSRLMVSNLGWWGTPMAGTIVEMNPAGMRAAGFRIGVDLLRMATASARPGVAGRAYADTMRLQSPPGAVTWDVYSGALPAGLALDATTGVISGIPETPGNYRFTVRGASGGRFGFGTFTLVVTAPTLVVTNATDHFLGGTPLPLEAQRYLDFAGNRNGRYDVGDLRAYLRSQGLLPAWRAEP
jgi:streptogramin lyase